jgi:hypothetical protein
LPARLQKSVHLDRKRAWKADEDQTLLDSWFRCANAAPVEASAAHSCWHTIQTRCCHLIVTVPCHVGTPSLRPSNECRTKVLLGPKYVDWDAAGEGIDSRKRQAARRFAKLKVCFGLWCPLVPTCWAACPSWHRGSAPLMSVDAAADRNVMSTSSLWSRAGRSCDCRAYAAADAHGNSAARPIMGTGSAASQRSGAQSGRHPVCLSCWPSPAEPADMVHNMIDV